MLHKKIFIYSFYRFKENKNIKLIKKKFDSYLKNKMIKGTILLAKEGINGSISGLEKDLDDFIFYLKKILKIRKLSLKKNNNDFIPFYRLKVRLKKEIVTIGKKNLNHKKITGIYIKPSEWNKLITKENVKLIDTRNSYEIDIGKFKNAVNPKTNSFTEFPKIFEKLNIDKNKPIAMYCTGGIRCEKASSYLIEKGYKNVMQLNGGILNYLKYQKGKKNENLWRGECFVFDNRVAVNKNLKKGKYLQCHGCRHPITKKETKSIYYKKGVHCPYCYNIRTIKQFQSSKTRQNQIDIAEKNNKPHRFKKISIKNL